jgi:hypothetical protein
MGDGQVAVAAVVVEEEEEEEASLTIKIAAPRL